jgi:hypothetical protein
MGVHNRKGGNEQDQPELLERETLFSAMYGVYTLAFTEL